MECSQMDLYEADKSKMSFMWAVEKSTPLPCSHGVHSDTAISSTGSERRARAIHSIRAVLEE